MSLPTFLKYLAKIAGILLLVLVPVLVLLLVLVWRHKSSRVER